MTMTKIPIRALGCKRLNIPVRRGRSIVMRRGSSVDAYGASA